MSHDNPHFWGQFQICTCSCPECLGKEENDETAGDCLCKDCECSLHEEKDPYVCPYCREPLIKHQPDENYLPVCP